MDTLTYPEIQDVDELFGFSAARERAREAVNNNAMYEEPSFIPHRIFMNQVDTFNAQHIAAYLTEQNYKPKSDTREMEGEGEGEAEPEAGGEEQEMPIRATGLKYEIVGTLLKDFHKKTEDILFTINENDEDFKSQILKCGVIVYDITQDSNEIPKALATLQFVHNYIEALKDLGPKTFKGIQELRVFVLLSSVMTWALTKPIDPEEPDAPFSEADYKKRKTHPNYKDHIDCEHEVVLKGRANKDKLKCYVIANGIIYGMEEDDLSFLFKLAWYNEELPLFGTGKNVVPLVYIKDVAKILHKTIVVMPKKQYILAVEETPAPFKQVIKALSKSMGSGKIKEATKEEAFLYSEMTQSLYDRYTVNLTMEPALIIEELEVEFSNESILVENMNKIVGEFKKTRKLIPIRIILHGPPAVGKTKIAKQLASFYGAHYACVKDIVDRRLQSLRAAIEKEKAKIQAQEDKENQEGGDEVGDEDEEEEEEEINIEELQEQLQEIENTIAESPNGKLPDEQVIELMKAFVLSNPCQNQGYIIDGFPKTIEQAKEMFGGAGEENEEEAGEEEEGGGEGGGANKLLPDYVISLQATDEFLCERIMSLPERDIQGTHYAEEGMLRRLAEFRARNTEDNTMLNFFDEIEIHPIVINATEDKTEKMEHIMTTLTKLLGDPVSFALTPEEQEELYRLQEEQAALKEKERQMMQDLLQQQAVADYQSKMEEWTELLEQLQLEEEKLLTAQGEPLRLYLIKFIFPILSKGLLEIARLKPDDPVDFLAEYLFKKNPEGHMFDPAYTREGKRIIDHFKEKVGNDVVLGGKDKPTPCK